MTLEDLRTALLGISQQPYDPESQHFDADELLIRFINDREVTELYGNLRRWYS